jgi:hypothetical protein
MNGPTLQVLLRDALAYVPALHSVHSASPAAEEDPAGQAARRKSTT